MKYLLFTLISFYCTHGWGFDTKKDDFYLIDSMKLKNLNEKDQHLLDSCLTIFHNSQNPIDQSHSLGILFEKLYNSVGKDYLKVRFDFLKTKVEQEQKDSTWYILMESLVYSSNRLGWLYEMQNDLDNALNSYEYSLKISRLSDYEFGKHRASIALSWLYSDKHQYTKAVQIAFESLRSAKRLNDNWCIAQAYIAIADAHGELYQLDKSMKYYLMAIDIYKIGNMPKEIPIVNFGIGKLYYKAKVYDKGIHYLSSCLREFQVLPGKLRVGKSQELIAKCYYECGELDSALTYMYQASEIFEAQSYWLRLGKSYNSIGETLLKQGHNASALSYFYKSLQLSRKENLRDIQSETEYLLGTYYLNNNILKASEFSTSSLDLAIELKDPKLIERSAFLAYQVSMKKEKYQEALEYYTLFIKNEKKVCNDATEKQMIIDHSVYELNIQKRKSERLAEHNSIINENQKLLLKEYQLIKEKRKTQNQLIITAILTIVLFSFLTFYLKKKLNFIRKQKTTIEYQNSELSNKNQQILNSIHYAKRLQMAMLPSDKFIKEVFLESFILYQPKDIVSGDFYWMEISDKKIYISVADCTGHGVPGAMLSVVCSKLLTKSLKEVKVTRPSKILDQVVNLLSDQFSQSDERVQDGMDLGICCFDFEKMTLEYAGANNPLYYIRNGGLEIIQPDKQPIGEYPNRKLYTNSILDLKIGDCIYMFTDGYADQFGGEKNKKFKATQLKKILLDNWRKPMNEQGGILKAAINQWKGNLEQIDDICIIGIRVPSKKQLSST